MNIECLVGEIGSTTTLVHAFELCEGSLIWLAKGVSETSVEQGDVSIGLSVSCIGSVLWWLPVRPVV
jgi:hypothetical protein